MQSLMDVLPLWTDSLVMTEPYLIIFLSSSVILNGLFDAFQQTAGLGLVIFISTSRVNDNFPLECSQMDTTFNKLGDFSMPDFFTWLGYIVLHCPGLWHILLHLKVKSGAILMVKKDNFAAFLSLHFTLSYCAHKCHLCPLFESPMLLNQILPLLWQFYSQISTLSLLSCSSLPLSSHPHIFFRFYEDLCCFSHLFAQHWQQNRNAILQIIWFLWSVVAGIQLRCWGWDLLCVGFPGRNFFRYWRGQRLLGLKGQPTAGELGSV